MVAEAQPLTRRHKLATRSGTWALALLLSAGTVAAHQPVFYPAQGQSPDKQNQDQAACQSRAAQQTGATSGASAAPPPARVGDQAGGAAVGAAGAAIAGWAVTLA